MEDCCLIGEIKLKGDGIEFPWSCYYTIITITTFTSFIKGLLLIDKDKEYGASLNRRC
jgi:hypothetical protein